MPKTSKSKKRTTYTPPAAPPEPVIDPALVVLLAADILDGKPVHLKLGGMFEAVMSELNKRGYIIGTPTPSQRAAWILPIEKRTP